MKKLFKGLRVRSISAVLMVIGCLITILIFWTTIEIKRKHENLVSLMNDYTNCNLAINDLNIASGKLTYYAICLVETGDFKHLDRYYYELYEINRRGKALNIVQLSHNNDSIFKNTLNALNKSDELVRLETYAMSLVCSAKDVNRLLANSKYKKVQLQSKHEELSDAEKVELAHSILFSTQHQQNRNAVAEYTEFASDDLLNRYRTEENLCNKSIKCYVTLQLVFIITLAVLCVILYLILVFFVFIPLHKHLIAIQKNDRMKVQGSYEVRYIATAYNAVADKNALDASVLKHKAEHDPLTSLINREALDHIISVLSESKEAVAYLIIDIDLFKNINDKYGHIIGDKVLVNVAHLLNEQFRATDYVARIGGDEFAVIMTKFGTASIIDIIRRKIEGLNKLLQSEGENLPTVTLSVGVAVSDMGFKTCLIENADKALYRVKRSGRCNCSFYGAD